MKIRVDARNRGKNTDSSPGLIVLNEQGGLGPNAVAPGSLGESSKSAGWVTSHSITRKNNWKRGWQKQFAIHHFPIVHSALCLPPKLLRKHFFKFLLGRL